MKKFIAKQNGNKMARLILGASMLLLGVQGAFAACTGTLHFKKPDSWPSSFYVTMNNVAALVSASSYNASTGYYDYDLAKASSEVQETAFGLANANTAPLDYILAAEWNGHSAYDPNVPKNNRDIECPSTKGTTDVWVLGNPKKLGQTLVSYTEPNIKYFYIIPPDDAEWKSSVLMWSGDGTYASRQPLKIAPDMCGWYYAVWMDEQLPKSFIFFRDDDVDLEDAIGLDGWGANALVPIPLDIVYAQYNSNKVYFIADVDLAAESAVEVISPTDPGLEGNCTYKLSAIFYDTDASMHGAFTCDAYPQVATNGCSVAGASYPYPGNIPCIGVTPGIVDSLLDKTTKKPTYNVSSGCFVSQEAFDVMFKSTSGVNYRHCRDIAFSRNKNGLWEYDSYNESTGAFTPLNDFSSDAVCKADAFCAKAATVRPGLGNVRYGSGSGIGSLSNISSKASQKLGDVADWSAIEPSTGFQYIDLYPVSAGEFADGTHPDVYDNLTWDARIEGDNNQFFCFESHARFTYRVGAQFAIRGDDDIWVFIDNKLAVDLGGIHLPAPGYVNLDEFTGASGALVPGQKYDLDIFYCDRRTDMTNLRISTNMYIKQFEGISLNKKSEGGGDVRLGLCVLSIGDGDCAATIDVDSEVCEEEIELEIGFSILTHTKEPVPGCSQCDALTPYSVNLGGIDLTNPKVPKINQDKIYGLPAGTYYLAITVGDKTAYHRFKVKGDLGIVTQDIEFPNIDGDANIYPAGTKWKFEGVGLAGTRVPIYISAPDDQGTVDLVSAANQSYTLTLTAGAVLYKNKNDETPLSVPYNGMIDENGIDTLWVSIPLAGLTAAEQKVTASVGSTDATITFYAPQLTFAKPKTVDESTDEVLTWTPMDMDPDVGEDGSERFYWVNSDVDLYLIVVNPATGALCKECDFALALVDASSGVTGDVGALVDGVALVRIRSSKVYDDPSQPAATVLVGAIENDRLSAPYGNMHFIEPPVPVPILVDLFDVKGIPMGEMNLPSKYYSETADYLDGRADSMVVVYDRKIDRDSVPSFLCLNFDESYMERINPYEMGISSLPTDNEMLCSTKFDSIAVAEAYSKSPDGGRTLVFAVDEPLSRGVKTKVNPDNKIASFTTYKWKGEIVKTFFEQHLTDRMAPVILSASVSSGEEYDQMKIVASEPVILSDKSVAKEAFAYYLNSAAEGGESKRFSYVASVNEPKDKSDTLVLRYYNADSKTPAPKAGDYIRFRADKVLWTDIAGNSDDGLDSLRSKADADYHWNSPTSYDAAKRLPSPWALVKPASTKKDDEPGDDPNDESGDSEFAEPSFRVKMVGPFEFKIVMVDGKLSAKARAYAVMDLQGRILRQGEIVSSETVVSGLNCGSYIVKVGLGSRRVNIR